MRALPPVDGASGQSPENRIDATDRARSSDARDEKWQERVIETQNKKKNEEFFILF
jgi:hypothetical protein